MGAVWPAVLLWRGAQRAPLHQSGVSNPLAGSLLRRGHGDEASTLSRLRSHFPYRAKSRGISTYQPIMAGASFLAPLFGTTEQPSALLSLCLGPLPITFRR